MPDYTLSAKITGDSSGFEKAFATAQKTIDGFSAKFAGIGKKISSVGDSLTSKITKPALAATSALAGITLVKGWNRLTGIDDARAKLTGLGHDAQSVETIMNSALDSVKGTAFGLDEAATTAANAVAAGIKPGQELTKYLSMTADAAAIAGTSMSEMGSIINKVQTGQTVYTEDLEQLADRGLPVYQWLAEEAGVAASEVKQLASEGQISSQMLYSAIEKNIGGAAKIMGETSFSAALDNIGASVSRIGANFLDAGGQGGGFFSQLKPLMADFSESLGALETKASELGVKFGAAFADIVQKAQDLKARFDALSPGIQGLIVKAAGIGAAVAVGMGPALKITGSIVSGFGTAAKVAGVLTSPIGLVITAVAGLAAGFTYLMQTNESFRNTALSVWDAVSAGAEALWDTLQNRAGPVVESLKEKFASLKDSFSGFDFGGAFNGLISTVQGIYNTVSGVFSGLNVPVALFATGFVGIIAKLGSPISKLVTQILSMGSGIASGIGGTLPKILPVLTNFFAKFQSGGGIIGIFKTAISGLGGAISGLFSPVTLIVGAIALLASGFATLMATNENFRNTVIGLGKNIVSSLLPAFQAIMQTVTQIAASVMPVLLNLFNQLLPIIGQIVVVIMEVAAALAPMISQLVGSLLPVITNIITVVMNVVSAVMPALIAVLNAVMSVIQAVAPVVMNILSVVISVVTAIISAVSPLISFVGTVITAIMGVISPIVTFVANIIAGIIQVVGTITGAVSGVFSTVFSIISGVWNNVSSLVANVISGIGSVISGLTSTVGNVFNRIYSTVSSVMGRVQSFISGVFSAIRSSWSGLTGFVSGVFSGISGAVSSLVAQVKGFVNGVISGINAAVGLINMIPGVSIGTIPYLAHGTDDWQGGFAYMNEGGRGELTYLPNGAQVIPHDVSMKYAREAAKANNGIVQRTKEAEPVTRNVNQTVNIYQPVKSPVETARALKRAGRELAYGR